MVFTSIRDVETDELYLINLEQLCYIKRNEEEATFDLWFSHERGLGMNAITIGQEDADKVFALIKEYASHETMEESLINNWDPA